MIFSFTITCNCFALQSPTEKKPTKINVSIQNRMIFFFFFTWFMITHNSAYCEKKMIFTIEYSKDRFSLPVYNYINRIAHIYSHVLNIQNIRLFISSWFPSIWNFTSSDSSQLHYLTKTKWFLYTVSFNIFCELKSLNYCVSFSSKVW